jgi:hypothetical protein
LFCLATIVADMNLLKSLNLWVKNYCIDNQDNKIIFVKILGKHLTNYNKECIFEP